MIIEKYRNISKEVSLCIEQSKVEAIRERNIKQFGVRVYDQGFIGIAGSNGDVDEEEIIANAKDALEYKIPYSSEPTKDRMEEVNAVETTINENDFISNSRMIVDKLNEEHPDYIFSGKVNLINKDISMENDSNLNLMYLDQYVNTNIFFKHKNSLSLFDGAFNFKGRKFDSDEFFNYANGILKAGDTEVDLPEGKTFPVIFSTLSEYAYAYGFINTYFARDLHAQTMETGSSLLSGKIGEKVFSDSFTLYQSLNPEDISEPFFDMEGVVNKGKEFTFIENGKVISPFTDKETSNKYNLPLSGSAMGDFNGVPGLGSTDTGGVPEIKPYGMRIKETEKTMKELLNGDMGIYVVFSLGGNYSSDGNYAGAVQYALLFDGEKFIGKLPQITVYQFQID